MRGVGGVVPLAAMRLPISALSLVHRQLSAFHVVPWLLANLSVPMWMSLTAFTTVMPHASPSEPMFARIGPLFAISPSPAAFWMTTARVHGMDFSRPI